MYFSHKSYAKMLDTIGVTLFFEMTSDMIQTKDAVQKILSWYEGENAGTRTQLMRILSHGALKDTGKLLIYPPDQGFEHGPGRSFAGNPNTYDPLYHFEFAIKGGFSALAAPLGLLEMGAHTYAGRIPLILKVNHSNTLHPSADLAQIADIEDALRLGCVGVGYTIYPGSPNDLVLYEKLKTLVKEAKKAGLLVIVWAYPRGVIPKEYQTALDVVAYGAHMACLLGAHIVKVKIPSPLIYDKEAKANYDEHVPMHTIADCIAHVVETCFCGKRLVLFSGGEVHSVNDVLTDVKNVASGGGSGSIMARNCYKRPEAEAMDMLHKIIQIYKNAAM